MAPRPDEIANVCAIYAKLKTDCIVFSDLVVYVTKGKLIDSDSSTEEIIQETQKYDLVNQYQQNIYLTRAGKELGKKQQFPQSRFRPAAKDFLLAKVYLNPQKMPDSCKLFLLQFKVNAGLETFVLDRNENNNYEEIHWLKIFNRLGLLEVNELRAYILPQHLALFNLFLETTRGLQDPSQQQPSDNKDDIGDFAENCAKEYEIERLIKRGHPDLALLVQKISKIDKSAGYDLISRKGIGKNPEEEIFIEAKGTQRSDVYFIWSRNERRVAKQKANNYWVYVFTRVDLGAATFSGPIRIQDPIVNLKKKGYLMEPLGVEVKKG